MNQQICRQLASLHNQDNAHEFDKETNYRAPHQAILLLVAIEKFENHPDHPNLILANNETSSRWNDLFSHITRKKSEYCLPFYAMGEYPFWDLVTRNGQKAKKCRHNAEFESIFEGAKLSSEFYQALESESSRRQLAQAIIETHFHPSKWFEISNLLKTFRV